MGKNQQHKSRQQARLHQSSSAQGEGEPASGADGVDASFHSAEWHAARVAALQVERPSWESWRLKQKEDEEKERAVLDEQERAMREYKALLEADRAKRLDSASIADGREEDSDRRRRKKKRREERREHKRRRHSHDGKQDRRNRSSDSSGSDAERDKYSRTRQKRIPSAQGTSGGPIKLSEYLNS